MRAAVSVPVTVKIRLGWNTDHRNYMDLARAAVEGGAAAITVHGRTREARYRQPADWDAISEVAHSVGVPVIGNGDLLFGHEIQHRLATSGCAAVMSGRGVLVKPWIFREAATGYWDISAEERLAVYRRYVALAVEHWGRRHEQDEAAALGTAGEAALDTYGRERVRDFLRWHVGFWVRYAPRRTDGSWPSMQQRESVLAPRSPLESLLARTDDRAIDYITDQLVDGGDLTGPPPIGTDEEQPQVVEAG
jgi:tRNA-dihydrouridine synthase 3